MQRASLVEKSRQKPQERIKTVTEVSIPYHLYAFLICYPDSSKSSCNLSGHEKLLLWWGSCAFFMWYFYRKTNDPGWWPHPWNPKGSFVHFFLSLFFSWDVGGGGGLRKFLVGSRQYNVCPCNSQLKVGNSEDCIPRNGRWNFNNKVLFWYPVTLFCHFCLFLGVGGH